MTLEGLPGAELVRQGLDDLHRGRESTAALLVAIGAPRLRGLGLDLGAAPPKDPEHRLYTALCQQQPADAYSRYNALIRLLVSFERALELEQRLEPPRSE